MASEDSTGGSNNKSVLRVPTRPGDAADAAAVDDDVVTDVICCVAARRRRRQPRAGRGEARPQARRRHRRAVGSRALVEFELNNADTPSDYDVAFIHKGRSVADRSVQRARIGFYAKTQTRYSSLQAFINTTGKSCAIVHVVLPVTRLHPQLVNAGTRFSDPEKMQG